MVATDRLCPLCGAKPKPAGTRYSPHAGRDFHYGICPDCGLGLVLDPREDYAAIYDHDYYLGLGADPNVHYLDEMSDPNTIRNLEWAGLAESLAGEDRSAKILDFGCGLGGFVKHLRNIGWDAVGFEDEGYARTWMAEHQIATASELTPDTYDVVFAVEVMEHLIEPLPVLEAIRQTLKPGGRLIITTGNFAKAKAPLPTWSYSVIPDVHVTFWTPQCWNRALLAAGLAIAKPSALSPGVTQYKILKSLPAPAAQLRRIAPIWRPLATLVDKRFGVSEFADGIAS